MSRPAVPLIELNDSGIRCFFAEATPEPSPGFALLASDKIVTGEQARRQAYLSPHRVFNQFWHQLNLSPLPVKSPLARHHADLAYAQLQQLHGAMAKPSKVFFAVPGYFSREQLGILLGLAQASQFDVAGIADSALLAAGQLAAGRYLHLDIQLHQLTLTEIEISGTARRGKVEQLAALGLKPLLDNFAHALADCFIKQYRYDPLHSAAGEQQLHDRLPGWLESVVSQGETLIELQSSQGNYQLNITESDLLAVLSPRLEQLQHLLAKQPGHQVVLSHRLASIPGFAGQFTEAILLPAASLTAGFEEHSPHLLGNSSSEGKIGLVTALPVHTSSKVHKTQLRVNSGATHLVWQGRAYPLSDQLFYDLQSGELAIRENTPGIFVQADTGWLFRVNPEQHSGTSQELLPGDHFTLHGKEFLLIEVR